MVVLPIHNGCAKHLNTLYIRKRYRSNGLRAVYTKSRRQYKKNEPNHVWILNKELNSPQWVKIRTDGLICHHFILNPDEKTRKMSSIKPMFENFDLIALGGPGPKPVQPNRSETTFSWILGLIHEEWAPSCLCLIKIFIVLS